MEISRAKKGINGIPVISTSKIAAWGFAQLEQVGPVLVFWAPGSESDSRFQGGEGNGGNSGNGIVLYDYVFRRKQAVRGPGPCAVIPPEDRLRLGFFQPLTTPNEERNLVDGRREFALGKYDSAFSCLQDAVYLSAGIRKMARAGGCSGISWKRKRQVISALPIARNINRR